MLVFLFRNKGHKSLYEGGPRENYQAGNTIKGKTVMCIVSRQCPAERHYMPGGNHVSSGTEIRSGPERCRVGRRLLCFALFLSNHG